MPAASDDAATTLAIMREWSWENYNPDGKPYPPGMALGTIINRLAIEGVRRPSDVVIWLLCNGDLLAKGSYRWQKFQDLERYQQEDTWERIPAKHWQNLAYSIQQGKQGDSDCFIETTLQLNELGLRDCLTNSWNTHDSSFSYASLTHELEIWDDDYAEEWFSAWDIEAWPRFLDEPETIETSNSTFATDVSEAKRGRGRSAAKWWPDFAEELAVFIHEEGIPDGFGHDGQSEVLDKVYARLAAAGKPEPGRATVQPVINAVLARIRLAGK